MTVSSRHPQYDKYANNWALVRDVIQSDVKKHIKDVDKSDPLRSKRYKDDAQFTNFTGRTKAGLVGSVFRKEPHFNLIEPLEYMNKDCTGYGESLAKFAQEITGEVVQLGRYGILTDYPKTDIDNISKADAERLNLKARFCKYPAESIINWNEQNINGLFKITLVVLKECSDNVDPIDGFSWVKHTQYRVLRLINGMYVQQIYNEDEEQISSHIPLDINGNPWDYIPFEFVGAEDNDSAIDASPLYDLARLNIGHLRNSADYEESVFISGQPTLVISSELSTQEWMAANPQGIKIGSRSGLQLGPNGDAQFLQASPNLLADAAMKRKEEQAIMIGAKLITASATNETAEAARMRFSGETSILSTIVHNIEDVIIKSLKHALRFMYDKFDTVTDEQLIVKLNDQFFDQSLDANTIMAQIQLAEKGVISKTDIRTLLRKHGQISEGRTDEDIDLDPNIIEIKEEQKPQRDFNVNGTGSNDDNDI